MNPEAFVFINLHHNLLVSSLLEEIKHNTRKRPNARTEFVAQEFVPIYLQSGITYVGSDKSSCAANWTQFKLERVSSKLGDFRHGKREETSEAWSMVRTCQNQMDNDLKMENWSTNFGVWVKPGF